ncbi:hypothetical protein ACGRHY_30000 [Streptomyces sp. HK10]|uniref:hypothetical protein n=1 Tax=Streptomyces sp. HK10 TaxID=3373255 RepID=UPI0037496F32
MADYVTLRVTPASREALRTLTYALTGQVSRRVDLSEALTAACKVAQQNLPATVTALTGEERTE